MERKQNTRKTDSILHQLAMPAALLFLSVMFGVIGWGGNQVLTDVKDNVIEIKNSQEKIWASVSTSKSTVDCIQNQLVKCCKDSIYCG